MKAVLKKSILLSLALSCSLSMTACDASFIDDLFPQPKPSSGSLFPGWPDDDDIINDPLNSSGSDTVAQVTQKYIAGEGIGLNNYYAQLSDSTAMTAAALAQSILTVNSLLYTDLSETSFKAFEQRKANADRALAILEKYAQATDDLIDANASKFQTESIADLTPDDVLATVASGKSNQQLKTLMNTYKVNAKTAKDILDSAMAGLSSRYKKEGDFYDTATRTATLVKEGAGLTLTIAGGVMTAGGVSGAMALGPAVITLITGADGAIKVSKAGVELIVGKDIKATGKVGVVMDRISDVSEIIGFKDLLNLKKWTDSGDRIANVVNVVLKGNDVIQGGELNLGSQTIELKKIGQVLSDFVSPIPPTTLVGKHRIEGDKKVTQEPTDELKTLLDKLPAGDRVVNATDAPETEPSAEPSSIATATPVPSAVPQGPSTTGYLEGWCNIPVTLTGASLTSDEWVTGWRYNGQRWEASANGSVVSIQGGINCSGPAWSYQDYTYSITIKARGSAGEKILFSDSGTLSKDGGSKNFAASFDAKQEAALFDGWGGDISVSASVGGGNPEGSTRYTSGTIRISNSY